MLQVQVYRLSSTMGLFEQMRCVRRSNALFRQMPADAQVRRILSLFHGLMPRPRIARCLLLGGNTFRQFSVTGFELAARTRYVFFHNGEFRFRAGQLLFSRTYRVGTAHARPNEFCAFIRQTRPLRHNTRRERFQVGRSWIQRMQIGKLL